MRDRSPVGGRGRGWQGNERRTGYEHGTDGKQHEDEWTRGGIGAAPRDAVALAAWFAGQLEARELVAGGQGALARTLEQIERLLPTPAAG